MVVYSVSLVLKALITHLPYDLLTDTVVSFLVRIFL